MPSVVSDYNKIQINETLYKDPNGKITSRSLMINIRTDDIGEAHKLHKDLKQMLNGNMTIEDKNDRKENDKSPICDKCGAEMISRHGKNGPFWGCSNYSNGSNGCNFTKPISEIEEIPTIETPEDIPF